MTGTVRKINQELVNHQVQSYWDRFRSGYPIRFARLLHGFLSDKSAEFSVDMLDEGTRYRFASKTYVWSNAELPVQTPLEPDRALDVALVQLEQALELNREEIRRRQEIVLSKLTEEERRLLNL